MRHHRHVILNLIAKFCPNDISIFQDGDHGIAILLPVSFFVTLLIWDGRNLPADQILARYLNPRLKYYNIRFLKTNGHHAGILVPVSIFTFASLLECYSTPACQISSKWGHPRHIYDVISILHDGGHSIAILLRVLFFVTAHLVRWKSTCRSNFGEISQSRTEILLHPVSENKRSQCWNSILPVSIFTCASPSACHSASAYQISSKSDHPGYSYDFISIFKMAVVSHIEFSQGNCKAHTMCK